MKKKLLKVHEALEKEKRGKSENVRKELLKIQKSLEEEKVKRMELHRNDKERL